MTNIYLSIIIPVYNVEGYLRKCIESIISQDFQDFELILINDGSTDGSRELCEQYALNDNRIKVFHQKNSGVSVARNSGLEKAQGELICFVDGDDEIFPGSLNAIFNSIDKSMIEMIIARSFKFQNGDIEEEKYNFDQSYFKKQFEGFDLIVEKSYLRGSVCGCIFNLNFLKKNRIKFPEGLANMEDSIFISLVHLYIKQIIFVDQKFYLVKERSDSASRIWTFDKIYNLKNSISFINDFLAQNSKLSYEQINILHFSIYNSVSTIFNKLIYSLTFKNYLKILSLIKKELKGEIDTGDIRINKGKIKLLNTSLVLFSIIVILNRKIRIFFNIG
ncbi:glycosyltransferase family 2 protein [Mongoliibacter ruber]|uniref:Glycosyltransferase involved in cell wall biosynthesis n=1 Tax=Mongoliibacter ruber TaxID=1750599 RepID=A0A2T0WNU3_9BACT|nr:glycosyltransferase [Mongoliibacter ruber]PRY88366.1 glycosyltransferase involved in cell wall biosynthesis [Mongoliibacter ruber]